MLVDREFKDCSAPSQLIGTGQEARTKRGKSSETPKLYNL